MARTFFAAYIFWTETKQHLQLVSQTLLDALHTTDLQTEKGLARKLIGLSLQMVTELQDVAGSREISVTQGRELVSKKL